MWAAATEVVAGGVTPVAANGSLVPTMMRDSGCLREDTTAVSHGSAPPSTSSAVPAARQEQGQHEKGSLAGTVGSTPASATNRKSKRSELPSSGERELGLSANGHRGLGFPVLWSLLVGESTIPHRRVDGSVLQGLLYKCNVLLIFSRAFAMLSKDNERVGIIASCF